MKTILNVIEEELVQLPQFLKIVLQHLGLNDYLSLSTMTEADFTEIEKICGSEFQNLRLAETDFYEYYTENVVVSLRPAHKRLLNGIKASLKETGFGTNKIRPKFISLRSYSTEHKKKPAKSKGIAQQSSKLSEILENLTQRTVVIMQQSRAEISFSES
jgi:hypothetical protein